MKLGNDAGIDSTRKILERRALVNTSIEMAVTSLDV